MCAPSAGQQIVESQAGPEKKRKEPRWRKGSSPPESLLLTVLPPLHRHGRMDHSGEAAGGGCPAALHHDRKVRL